MVHKEGIETQNDQTKRGITIFLCKRNVVKGAKVRSHQLSRTSHGLLCTLKLLSKLSPSSSRLVNRCLCFCGQSIRSKNHSIPFGGSVRCWRWSRRCF